MAGAGMLLLIALSAVVLAPLAFEYADLRRACGLSRTAALGTTALVLPSFAVGWVLAQPLSVQPVLHWTGIVGATLLVYSVAARAIVSSASGAGTAPSRNTRG
jgi:ABC-type nickel/cobalt efflux system permease component RcnA